MLWYHYIFINALIMIPADIDNFMVTRIANSGSIIGCIYIRDVDILPKEISNCVKLTLLHIQFTRMMDISALSNCRLLTKLYLHHNKIEDISALENCKLLTISPIGNNRIQDISTFSNQQILTSSYVY